MAPAVYPQKIFHIFSIDDLCSPLRSTTPYETLILQNIVDKVALFFTVPRVLRLVAISLKKDVPCHVTPKAPESVNVTEDDLAFAKKALEGLPQLELVQGLSSEARVIRSADPTDDTPTAVKPVRIQVRAEVRISARFT
jgi:hypothetical protein